MVGASIDSINHRISRSLEFIIETAINEAADDRIVQALADENIVGSVPLNATRTEASVDALDDVAAFTQGAQSGFGLVGDCPLFGTNFLGQGPRLPASAAVRPSAHGTHRADDWEAAQDR